MSDPFFLGVQIITLTENVITGTVYQSLIYCFGVSGLLCVLMFVYYYTVCYFTGIFNAVVREISVLFMDSKDSVFCILKGRPVLSTSSL